MKYLKLLFLGLLFTGCASFHLSTLNHDPIYDTVLVVPADVQIDTLSSSQLRWKLRTDFRFRYDFAQYALSQPRSFDWNNRVLGNRYNVYNPYYGFGYSNYWSRDMMWNDWVWGYNSYNMWSPFRYDRWGYNHYGWNSWGWNGYYGNSWGWRQQMNNYAWQHRNRPNTAYINGRRGSTMSIRDRIGQGAMIESSKRENRVIEEEKIVLLANKLRKRVNNKNIRVYNNPNNPNLNNNSKPRVYVRPNNNSNNNTPPRIYNRPPVNTNNSSTRPSGNVSRSNSVSRGGNSNRKN
ncbi:MAG: hypothetical protein HN487_08550 [Flavobacterium sp.]|nr:hypothetical protein [Flavobacterium sp.]